MESTDNENKGVIQEREEKDSSANKIVDRATSAIDELENRCQHIENAQGFKEPGRKVDKLPDNDQNQDLENFV